MRNLTKRTSGVVVLILASLGSLGHAGADTVIPATNAGIYIQTGDPRFQIPTYNLVNSGSYQASIIGALSSDRVERRDFFVFDLSKLTAPIPMGTSVSLSVPDPSTSTRFGGDSLGYTLFDVTTPVATLVTGGNQATLESTFVDLGSGVNYSDEISSTSSDSGHVITIPLNSTAVTAIDAAFSSGSHDFAIGGAITREAPGAASVIFGNSSFPTVSIGISVPSVGAIPEPTSLTLGCTSALAGLGYWWFRRRGRAVA